MQRIFVVHGLDEWPENRNINGPAWGMFSNFEAAENLVKDSSQYRNAFVIIETNLTDNWPLTIEQIVNHKHNKLTYYVKTNNEMVRVN